MMNPDREHASTRAGQRSSKSIVTQLGRYFRRNGYVRRQNPNRLARDGYRGYKKGDEVRLTARDPEELERIRELLHQADIVAGRPFLKGRQYRLPIYGREAVRRFLKLIGIKESAKPRAASNYRPTDRRAVQTRRKGGRR